MISNNSSVIINNADHKNESNGKSKSKLGSTSPTSSTSSLPSSPCSRSSSSSLSPTPDASFKPLLPEKVRNSGQKISRKSGKNRNSLSDCDLTSTSTTSTLSSQNSSSTSGIANSITYFPSLDEEGGGGTSGSSGDDVTSGSSDVTSGHDSDVKVVTSTPVCPDNNDIGANVLETGVSATNSINKNHSLRFFVNPASGKVDLKASPIKNRPVKSYDTRSLDRRRLYRKPSLVEIKEKPVHGTSNMANYCTLSRGGGDRNRKCLSNFTEHKVRMTVEKPEVKIKTGNSDTEIEDVAENGCTTDCTSDDGDDLSHAEELLSTLETTSVESLTSGSGGGGRGCGNSCRRESILPTGWHRHPGMPLSALSTGSPFFNLGPLEIEEDLIHNADSEAEEAQYSTIVKKNQQFHQAKTGYSSRIIRRHTTYYYNARQFDSLPPQGTNNTATLSSCSNSILTSRSAETGGGKITKPHVHSWHRHKSSSRNKNDNNNKVSKRSSS